ncbi:MAG: TlpA family protein disulfide reductase [Cyclobacteriaceae bacterium]
MVNNRTKLKYILSKIWQAIKPWAGALLVVILLHLTGLLSSITVFTQTAVLHTGLLDAKAESEDRSKAFDFDFTVKDLDGRRIDFSEYEGNVIFLNIWATWCGPCRAEMPTIHELYKAIGNHQSIKFVMLSIDKDEHHAKVVRYIADRNFSFPVYMPSGYLPAQLQVPNIPTTFVISKEGNIILKEIGTTNFNTKRFQKFMLTEANK